MFQPPDPRNMAKIPVARTQDPSPLGWSVFVGVVFAAVRFSIGAIYALMLGAPLGTWYVSCAAAVCAGVIAGAMFWRLQVPQPKNSKGALVGVAAAIGSYLGVVIAALVLSMDSENGAKDPFIAVFGSIACGAGSAMITGMAVFPSLVILGVLLSAMYRADPANRNK
jgi:hypothetical protein